MNDDLVAKTRQITYHSKERIRLFRDCFLPEQSAVLAKLSPHLQQALLKKLTVTEIVNILDHMDLRTAKQVVGQIKDISLRTKITSRLKIELKEKIEHFLRFHPKATMALVHFSYILVSQEEVIGSVADDIEGHYHETGKFPEVLVTKNGVLQGEVIFPTLVRERNSSKVKTFIKPVSTISYRASINEIIQSFTHSNDKKIVVLDEDKSVLGIIYADDALALFGDLPVETFYQVSGVDSNEQPLDRIMQKFSRRYRWLIFNLVTAFLAGFVVLLYKDTIDQLAIMAAFIPIVAGMGGNAASQAFAVMLRGISLGTVTFKDRIIVIGREAVAGLFNGLVIGAIVAVIAVVVYGDGSLGLVVGITMVFVHIVAAVTGAFIPLYLKHKGLDPATVTSMIMTTVTDVFGIAFLLGLATWWLL